MSLYDFRNVILFAHYTIAPDASFAIFIVAKLMKSSDALILVLEVSKVNTILLCVDYYYYTIYTCTLLCLQNGDNIVDEIEKRNIAAPYIIQAGPANARQYFLVAENIVYVEVDDFLQAVAAVVGLYYVYNVVYPKQWNNCLLFMEKKLLGITSGPSINALPAGVISDIEKIP